jgi:predicted cupin superfamily sugar epimerase
MHYNEVIKKLDLIPLPEEGGFYRETFRSPRYVTSDVLGKKSECTSIYYLVTQDSFSALHAVDQYEIFHFYAGSPVEMLQLSPEGNKSVLILGNDIMNGEIPQVIVPFGVWQGTKLKNPKEGAWALLGCTVSPGFEFENFHFKPRNELISLFPQHKEDVIKFTN